MSNSPKQFYQQAMIAFREGKREKAISLLEEAVRFNPNDTDILESLGVLYANVGRLEEAIQTMKRLARADPDHIMAHTNLSRFYQQKGLIDEAEAEQAEARRLSWKAELKTKKTSGDVGARHAVPLQTTEEELRQIERRIQTAQKAIAFDPKDVLGYFTLGSVYLDAKRFIEAVDVLKQALLRDSRHSPSYASLGQALEQCGQREEAKKIYEEGIKVASQRGDIVPLRRMESRLKKLMGLL
ncbi:MAG: tetratricopeptide repeat protein [Candidatus Omnitrophica bacterium]|nr:tetratricopeptide repeat protein [Candidatus Omnitrophota bacterium]